MYKYNIKKIEYEGYKFFQVMPFFFSFLVKVKENRDVILIL